MIFHLIDYAIMNNVLIKMVTNITLKLCKEANPIMVEDSKLQY
jgi:hypothetical protein